MICCILVEVISLKFNKTYQFFPIHKPILYFVAIHVCFFKPLQLVSLIPCKQLIIITMYQLCCYGILCLGDWIGTWRAQRRVASERSPCCVSRERCQPSILESQHQHSAQSEVYRVRFAFSCILSTLNKWTMDSV